MALRVTVTAKPALHARVKLGALFAMSDAEFLGQLRKIELNPVFQRMLALGIIRLERYPRPRSTSHLYPEYGAQAPLESADPLHGDEGVRQLIQEMGQELFSRYFLGVEALSDAQKALLCGISVEDAAKLRAVVDSAYVQAEFEPAQVESAPAAPSHLIGGIELEKGRPVLAFYHREIWKGRYRIDQARRGHLKEVFPAQEARQAELLLKKISFLNRRTATLYRVLQALMDFQAEYLIRPDPALLKPLALRELGRSLKVDFGALSRLLRGKSIRLPSGREIALKSLLVPRKSVLKDRLYVLLSEKPSWADGRIAQEFAAAFGISITRRSVCRYRRELGLLPLPQRSSCTPKSISA